ncbi:hypothetical protein Lmor_3048 [Legionella moravica]|uniref:Transmembrane protein (Fibronectin III domain and Gp5 C-terminal repeat) n=1 Tax=Legionella moravica TaxID=39962 RepID=A0A378K1N1_9GAMM|nr:DUF1566 domain-containing protein [Legionella moravica]KTD30941.1 hypothetical protein Lmor_3048 [Legionella moravica]STX63518.1 transmembrane protein (fibronectin III domain and Gp5 C-terminal repeat) [Legionella moravica]
MRGIKGYFFKTVLCAATFLLIFLSSVQAAKPLWTFTPQTATELNVYKGGMDQVIYTVKNQSTSTKNLVLKPITGIQQSTPCLLPANGTCTLTLIINGATLQGDVLGGPVLCQAGNNLMCYSPSQTNQLRIHLAEEPPPPLEYTVTPIAGANGAIVPAVPQVVNPGSSILFTASPDSNFGVDQWFLDGNVVQNGGTTYQLNTINSNHTIEVTFSQTTLSPLTQNLALSINSPLPISDPALIGNPRIIRIQNTGTIPAINLQVSSTAFPVGTSITNNTCTGTLNPGATCDIRITPGGTSSPNVSAISCSTAPGTAPLATVVTVVADNASPTDINVLLLGQGCIYQGGYLFSVDDTTPDTGSIGGKVAALANGPTSVWGPGSNITGADRNFDGVYNTNILQAPAGQYPPVQFCFNSVDQGFSDWYAPAICELTRYIGVGRDPYCYTVTYPNLYSTLIAKGKGNFPYQDLFSSTQAYQFPANDVFAMRALNGVPSMDGKQNPYGIRCIRSFTP